MEAEIAVQNKVRIEMPKLYRVILHNDNKTTFEFVLILLVELFDKTPEEAYDLTMAIHEDGSGIAGLYPHGVAEQKVEDGIKLARISGFPLQLTLEED